MSKTVKNYLSLVKFSHTIFAMPFALIGFFTGVVSTQSKPDFLLLIKVVLCMVFARTAAMAFNRYIDRKYDSQNERTKSREIPAGVISPAAALSLVIISAALFVAIAYSINSLCFYLSPIALAVVLGYSLTKRFTFLCHLILGIGLSLAPIGAYLAVTGKFDWVPLFFSFAVICWVSGFDIIYALQDDEFDRSLNLYSIPAYFGRKKALNISNVLHLSAVVFLVLAGINFQFSWIYWAGTVLFSGLIVYQHMLVKPTDLSKVNLAFATTNGIASLLFSVFVITDLLIH